MYARPSVCMMSDLLPVAPDQGTECAMFIRGSARPRPYKVVPAADRPR